MKQEERREQTVRLLLETTEALVQEKGCNGITMKDIMERSGLSKGAIFHYVKSKDEIFVWLLQKRLEETNARFMDEVEQGPKNFDGPMQKITDSIMAYGRPQDVTNKVLMYLLGKENEPIVAEALRIYYERSVSLSRQWIETGQRHGVIPASVDAAQTADLFVVMTLGLRMRSTIPLQSSPFQAEDLTSLMIQILQSKSLT
ncbi:TetR/AcrR family transcriptional regulator [Paenibacillus nanensis]|uniref:TetR/AcrR family transcriptional regulator n=1 Tax=Paenibacillus nanensis TaxID=393251 RepID=A0A3A1UT06_9BACL|nr:TetR/AcrR family transcriptional regulator [Paenibacillus nanensis]RIX51669.1 TetR/AcrR family transcriptional regulator [Paenibacillus nanensis]